MFTLNNKMMTGIYKRILTLFIALAFLLNSVSFAWARKGNYGEATVFSSTITGALSGVSASSSGTWAQTLLPSIINNVGGLYMYYNVSDYGKSLIQYKIGGKDVSISKGQFFSMVLATAASCVANMASSSAAGSSSSTGATSSETLSSGEGSSTSQGLLSSSEGTSSSEGAISSGTLSSSTGSSSSGTLSSSTMLASNAGLSNTNNFVNSFLQSAGKSLAINTATLFVSETVKDVAHGYGMDTTLAKILGDVAGLYAVQYGSMGLVKSADMIAGKDVKWDEWGGKADTKPLISAGIKIAFLSAMGYSTYRGSNKHKQFNNTVLMAMADGLGEVFATKYGMEKANGKSYEWDEALVAGLAPAASNIIWQTALHKAGINSDVGTEFGRLVLSGVVRGSLTKEAPTFEEYKKTTPNALDSKEAYLKQNSDQISKLYDEYKNDYKDNIWGAVPMTKDQFNNEKYDQYKAMKEDQYNNATYYPSTLGGNIRESIARGYIGAEVAGGKLVSAEGKLETDEQQQQRHYQNMHQYIDAMGHGQSPIQAQAGVLYNSFNSAANQNFGWSAEQLRSGANKNYSNSNPSGVPTVAENNTPKSIVGGEAKVQPNETTLVIPKVSETLPEQPVLNPGGNKPENSLKELKNINYKEEADKLYNKLQENVASWEKNAKGMPVPNSDQAKEYRNIRGEWEKVYNQFREQQQSLTDSIGKPPEIR